MANSFSIWKDQIILHWDGVPPPNCTLQRAFLISEPKLVIPYWEHIRKYIKYSKRLNAFMLSLSKQNLQRLRKQFGDIVVDKGHTGIRYIKDKSSEMAHLIRQTTDIKSGDLDEVPYKLPPLGAYQHVGVNLLTRCKKVPLFADCGMGKTYMTLVSIQEQLRRGLLLPGKTLVIAKLSTLFNGWKEDCEKFTHMSCKVLWIKQCSNRKAKLIALLDEPADIYVINHDGIRVLEEALIAKRFHKIVVDESTILKGFLGDRFSGGAFGKSLMNISREADWRVIMSGTPAPNGPQDLWGQFHFLDPDGLLLEKTIHDFRNTFMKEVFFGDPNNPNTPKTWVPTEDATERVGNIINPLSYRVRIRDHLKDLPEKTVIVRLCKMDDEQATHYRFMETALMTTIDNEVVTVNIALAKLSKLRQITAGFLIDNEQTPHTFKNNPKLEELDSLLEEINPEDKVVIYAQHRWEIEMLADRYKNRGVCTVYGGNAAHINLENINSFIKDKNTKLVILHPKSAAHGITFVVAHYMIFYSISYSEEDNYQCQARIERAGQKHPMFIYYLLCEESIDTDIYDVLKIKAGKQQEIIDADIIDKIRNRSKSGTKKKGKTHG